jgi:membrane protease YdiL (CAAX protease family)
MSRSAARVHVGQLARRARSRILARVPDASRPLSPWIVLALLGSALALLGAAVWAEAMVVALVNGLGAHEALGRVTRDPGLLAVAQLVGLGVPTVLAARLSDGGMRAFFSSALAPCPWDRVAFAFVAGLALQLPMVEIAHVVADLAPALRHSPEEDAALRETLRIRDLYTAVTVPLAVVVCAPVTEELLFRAFALRELAAQAHARRVGRVLAVGLVAVLFAVFHMDPVSTPAILLAGLALGAIADRWQSVRICVALHAGVNLVPVVLTEQVLLVPGLNDTDPDTHVSPFVLAASIVVFAAAFTLAWRRGARGGETLSQP